MTPIELKTGEALYIGTTISVRILSVHGGQISLGIRAPKAISVHRSEVYKRIKEGLELDRLKSRQKT